MFPARSLRHARRIIAIAEVASRHGFGLVIDQVGLTRWLWRRAPTSEPAAQPAPRRLLLAIQELGPTFIKLGQMLSTRPDVIPEEYVRELAKLQDEVPPAPWPAVARLLEEELGAPPQVIFDSFDPVPVAAASIGQVHHATTREGRSVVVKVQRPGIDRVISVDLEILAGLANLLEERIPAARRYEPRALVREFAETLHDELMYTIEGRNAERLRQALERDPERVYVPEVIWAHTTRRVLTLERVHGVKLTDLDAIEARNRPALAIRLAQSILRQVLVHGFFHGDPHPGNLFVAPDDTLVFMDLGIVGRMDGRTREDLIDLFLGIFRQDADRVVDRLTAIGVMSEDVNQAALRREVSRMLAKYYFLPRKELQIGEIVQVILSFAFRYQIRLPSEFALLGRALLTTEGLCMQLDPNFDFNQAARPFERQLADVPGLWRQSVLDALTGLRDLNRLVPELPRRFERLLTRLERGQLRARIEIEQSDRTAHVVAQAFTRLSFSVLVCGLLGISAFVTRLPLPPLIHGSSAWGLAGLAGSILLAAWFLAHLIRGGSW